MFVLAGILRREGGTGKLGLAGRGKKLIICVKVAVLLTNDARTCSPWWAGEALVRYQRKVIASNMTFR